MTETTLLRVGTAIGFMFALGSSALLVNDGYDLAAVGSLVAAVVVCPFLLVVAKIADLLLEHSKASGKPKQANVV